MPMYEFDEGTAGAEEDTPSEGREYSITILTDFPNCREDGEFALVDSLILMLFQERESLSDPRWRPVALARIEAARAALVAFGGAAKSAKVRCEMFVDALDKSDIPDRPIELRSGFVQVVLGEAMPNVTIDPKVVRDAVALWPKKKESEARRRAVRALAEALGCNHLSLMTMLRASRKDMRDRRTDARRARGSTM